jgi:putative tricarboxylic transport membrane protein
MSRGENIANLITLALGIFVTYHSFYALKIGILISPGAGFLPFLCGIALIVLGATWRLQSIRSKPARPVEPAGGALTIACEAETSRRPGSRVRLGLAFLSTVAYAFLFERIGFFFATLLFMFGWQMIVERQRWLKATVITILCAAAMHALFRYLLRVELPSNPWLS